MSIRFPHCYCAIVLLLGLPAVLAQEAHLSGNPPYYIEDVANVGSDPVASDKLAFGYFSDVDLMEKEEPGSQVARLQRNFMMDERAAQAFLTYIQRAVLELQVSTERLVQAQCDARSSILTGEDLNRAMSSIDNGIDQRKVELLHGADRILSQSDKLIVDLYLAKTYRKGALTNHRVDFVKFVEETGERPEAVMARFCAP